MPTSIPFENPQNDPQPWNDPQIDPKTYQPEMIPISLHAITEMIPN